MKMAPVKLTREDWQEIYYALWTKAHAIEAGHLGPDGLDDVSNTEWAAHLRGIAEKLGPDGKTALLHGTKGEK